MSNSNNYLVIKLGGTSQTKEGYNNLISEISKFKSYKIIIIVSAIKNVTNLAIDYVKTNNINSCINIISLNKKLCDNLGVSYSTIEDTIKYFDVILKKDDYNQDKINIISSGETLTAKILNTYLLKNNIKSRRGALRERNSSSGRVEERGARQASYTAHRPTVKKET